MISTGDGASFVTQSLAAGIGFVPTALAVADNHTLVLGSATAGVALRGSESRDGIHPEGPLDNSIADISFASSGTLYVAHGGTGLSVFDPGTGSWTEYLSGDKIPNETYRKVFYDSVRDLVWLSTYGRGFYSVKGLKEGAPVFTRFHSKDGIPTFSNDPNGDFIVAGGGALDRSGNFVMTTWAGDGEGASVTQDGQHFTNIRLALSSGSALPYGCVTQDFDGTYWVGTESHDEPKSYGVFWGAGSNTGSIGGGPGLPLANAAVNAILTDQDDGIWCGTIEGVQIISNPYAITSDQKFSIRSVNLLNQQVVHSIVVDGVGNKWIATENGIFVVSPDGSDSVARYSKDNSPLIDNLVLALAIDTRRGEVYAGTPSGISRFSTIFRQGNADYSQIRVYPNPVLQTGESSPTVFIDGLVSGSTVKILTLSGKLVATISGSALGSTVQWTGRDDLGRAVPSGMYLVTATSPQSGEHGAAKVVIVRTP